MADKEVPWFIRMFYPDIVIPAMTLAFLVFVGWASCCGR